MPQMPVVFSALAPDYKPTAAPAAVHSDSLAAPAAAHSDSLAAPVAVHTDSLAAPAAAHFDLQADFHTDFPASVLIDF